MQVSAFDVFSEQQIVESARDTTVDAATGAIVPADFDANTTEGLDVRVHWAKVDQKFSPLQGWDLEKTVRLGC